MIVKMNVEIANNDGRNDGDGCLDEQLLKFSVKV